MDKSRVLNQLKNSELSLSTIFNYFNKQNGIGYSKKMINCPFHDDNSPSMILNEDQSVHCFACDLHLDAVQLYTALKTENTEYAKTIWESEEIMDIINGIIADFKLDVKIDLQNGTIKDLKNKFIDQIKSKGKETIYGSLYTRNHSMADIQYSPIQLSLKDIYLYKDGFTNEPLAVKVRYERMIGSERKCTLYTRKGNEYILHTEASHQKPLKRKTFRFYNVIDGKIAEAVLPEDKKNLIYKAEDIYTIIKDEKKRLSTWIWFVEGEKDVDTLNEYGFTACSLMTGSGSNWCKKFNNNFRGCNIIIASDFDAEGLKYEKILYEALFYGKYTEERTDGIEENYCTIGLKLMNKKFYEINIMPEKSDITDLINKWKNIGLNKQQIKTRLLEIIDRSIDYKNQYVIHEHDNSLYLNNKKITNFKIVDAVNIVSIDSSQADMIKLTIQGASYSDTKSHTRIACIHEMFGSPDAFNRTFSVMDCTFLGSKDDLFNLKDFILKYKMFEKNYLYSANGMYKHHGEWVTVTPDGALRKDEAWDMTIFSSNNTMYNDIEDIKIPDIETINKVGEALLNFNVKEVVYNILGEVGCKLMNARYKELGIKNHLFSLNGTKGAGKTETSVKIIAAITNNNTRGEYNLSGQSNFTFLKNVSSNNIGGIILQELKLGKMSEYDRNKWSEIFRNSYDRSRSQRGTKDQQLNEYDHNNPLITTGEEGIGEESALYERFNIIFMTADKRNSNPICRENFILLCDNQLALKGLGKQMLIDIMNLSDEEIINERKDIEAKIRSRGLSKIGFIDRVLNNAINVIQGLIIINKSIKKLGYEKDIDIEEGFEYIINNFTENVLKIGDDSKANDDYQTMLLQYQKALDNNYVDKVVGDASNAYTVFDRCLWISPQKLRTVIANFTADSKSGIVLLNDGEFRKNLVNAGYISGADSEKKKFNQTEVKGWYYRVNLLKIKKLGLGFIEDLIDSNKITEPYEILYNKNIINMGIYQKKAGLF
ncbi:MAG: CHC2 zinc finger domain-containing protein [Lutispora sp.]|nr:CHC2 zinc finger domain-containing protein [Lutispora sp.]